MTGAARILVVDAEPHIVRALKIVLAANMAVSFFNRTVSLLLRAPQGCDPPRM